MGNLALVTGIGYIYYIFVTYEMSFDINLSMSFIQFKWTDGKIDYFTDNFTQKNKPAMEFPK